MALFTVEQVELIRRLRSSGITREQVLLAFTELERLEAEFGRSCSYGDQMQNHNMEFSFSSTSVVRSNCTASVFANTGIPNVTPVPNVNGDSLHIQYKHNDYFSSQPITSNGTNMHDEVNDSTVLNGDCSVNTSDIPSRLENELVIPQVNDAMHSVSCSESVTQNAYNSTFNCSFYPMDVQSSELAELQELKKKGDMAILAEIRNFVMTYNIKQTLIAEMTKMSQPYVSRFFRGDIQDMPDRTKNTFFMWYLTCKNNPLKLGEFHKLQ